MVSILFIKLASMDDIFEAERNQEYFSYLESVLNDGLQPHERPIRFD